MNTTPLKKIYQYASTGVDVGNAHHYWWCGNPASPGQVIDTIVYRSDGPDKQGVSAIALSPEPGEVHACDPSIIKGIFVFDERDYQFALIYTLLTEVGKPNELAWAVSNNLNGPWEKVGTLITVPEGWGAGQPSVTAVSGGKILLFYTYGSHQETTMRRAYVDLTDALRPNMIEDVRLTEEGLPYPLRGGAVVYDWRDRSFVIAYNGAQYPGHPPVSENVVVAKESSKNNFPVYSRG